VSHCYVFLERAVAGSVAGSVEWRPHDFEKRQCILMVAITSKGQNTCPVAASVAVAGSAAASVLNGGAMILRQDGAINFEGGHHQQRLKACSVTFLLQLPALWQGLC
jgi:hypothetical protein